MDRAPRSSPKGCPRFRSLWSTISGSSGHADSASPMPQEQTPATAETVYRVGSVSKLFTDLAVMQLVEQGRLDLDAPVTRVLPEFAPRNPFNAPITLRQLMSHRSGLVREPPVGHYFDPVAAASHRCREEPRRHDTASSSRARARKYSNAGIAVVGAVVERARGKPFPRRSTAPCSDPLGMARSSFEPGARAGAADGSWVDVDLRRPDRGDAHVLARHRARRATWSRRSTTWADFSASCSPRGEVRAEPSIKPETLQVDDRAPARQVRRDAGLRAWLCDLEAGRRAHESATAGRSMASRPRSRPCPTPEAGGGRDHERRLRQRDRQPCRQTALRLMLAARQGKPLPTLELSQPITAERARKLEGRLCAATSD